MVGQNKERNSEFPELYSSHIKDMQECMSICAASAKKCIEEGHKETAALCAECADICALAIKASSAQSELEQEIMELCTLACQKCGDACKNMQVKHCQVCAEVCKCCADACSGSHKK